MTRIIRRHRTCMVLAAGGNLHGRATNKQRLLHVILFHSAFIFLCVVSSCQIRYSRPALCTRLRRSPMSTVIRIAADESASWSPAKEKSASRSVYRVRPPPLQWRLRHLVSGAPKIKLLLIGLLLFSALAFFCWNLSSLMGWNLDRHSSGSSRGGFTVLINTRKQKPHELKQTVAHYASCIGSDDIRVVWTARNPPSQALISSLNKTIALFKPRRRSSKCNFGVDFENSGKSSSRFKLSREVTTEAVFSVDDDIIVPCSALSVAFTAWQAAPSSMVGFFPRMHWRIMHKFEMRKNGGYYEYGGWWSVWWKGSYSMVLSKAAFLHKKYLHLYFNNMPSSINHYLNLHRNCEDIAMSFLVANVTASPPIWVQGNVYEIGSSSWSISSLLRGAERRNKCLNDLISLYGTVPLVHTHFKAVDSRYQLFW